MKWWHAAALSVLITLVTVLISDKVMRAAHLPHRSLHEIDVQGHMPPMHGCVAVYDAPDGKLELCDAPP